MSSSTMLKAQVAGQLARMAIHTVRDRISPGSATRRTGIPAAPESFTVEWLTGVLCADTPGAQVQRFELGGGSSGSTSRRALRVEYNDTGRSAGLPTELYTKSTPDFTSRVVTVASGAAAGEALFYSVIRPSLEIEAPRGYYSACDARSGRSMFLLDDVAVTRGATFGDPRTVPIDRRRAEHIVRLLATVHGTFWNSPRLRGDLATVPTAEQFQQRVNDTINFRGRSLIGIERAESVCPAEFLHRRDEVWPAAMRSLDLHSRGPRTLLHSDVHSRNWYVTGDGGMGLYDWQLITQGNWALDVAYAISSALTVADRRSWERDLIALYVEELAAAGGDKLTLDDAWLSYRQQIFHALIFWLYTIGAGRLQPAMQPLEVSLLNLERMTNAVVDLDSLDSL